MNKVVPQVPSSEEWVPPSGDELIRRRSKNLCIRCGRYSVPDEPYTCAGCTKILAAERKALKARQNPKPPKPEAPRG